MPELIITRGLPGSGKTYWARVWVAGAENRARVNRDDLRQNLFGRDAPLPYELEKIISAAQQEAVRGLLRAGTSVVVDDTHLRGKYIRQWQELAFDEGADFSVNDDFLAVDVDLCIQRDLDRYQAGGRYVGSAVIRKMAEQLKSALRSEKKPADVALDSFVYTPNPSLPSAYIFDIDGTIARHTVRSPYEYDRVLEDEPIEPVLQILRLLEQWNNIILLSGREDSCRDLTKEWLSRQHINYDRLYMRAEGDGRDDALIKREIFFRDIAPHWNVLGIFDDRNRVVRMWRSLGLLCCQVAPGAF